MTAQQLITNPRWHSGDFSSAGVLFTQHKRELVDSEKEKVLHENY